MDEPSGNLGNPIRIMGSPYGPFFTVFAASLGSKKHGNLEIRKSDKKPMNRRNCTLFKACVFTNLLLA